MRATVDQSELGEINPDARASLAVNFDSELLPVARSGGVLVAGVTPTGGIVSGTVAALKLDGWTREDATLRDPAAVTVYWPALTIDRSPAASVSVKTQEKRRDAALEKLKNVFRDARAYAKARGAPRGRRACPGTTWTRSSRRSSRRSRDRSRSSSRPTRSRRSATRCAGRRRRSCGS